LPTKVGQYFNEESSNQPDNKGIKTL